MGANLANLHRDTFDFESEEEKRWREMEYRVKGVEGKAEAPFRD